MKRRIQGFTKEIKDRQAQFFRHGAGLFDTTAGDNEEDPVSYLLSLADADDAISYVFHFICNESAVIQDHELNAFQAIAYLCERLKGLQKALGDDAVSWRDLADDTGLL